MRVQSFSAAPLPLVPELPAPSSSARPASPFDRSARSARTAPAGPAAPRGDDPRSLAGLGACIDEARAAARVAADGPPDPASYAALLARVEKAAARLPPEYREAVGAPLVHVLRQLGASGYARVLREDPDRAGAAGLLLDACQAVLQHGEGYQARATAAFQEVVSDLYDGFLSAEARRGVKPPDHGAVPPLVRWGSADAGPYTWPASDTVSVDLGAGLVSLPAANATAGLLSWPALAHETAGHDVLSADDGLADELAGAVRRELRDAKLPAAIADYWADRIDETAADVLGVLNMGPAAAVGLVGYFRALNGAWTGTPTLRSVGPADDPHPADVARAYLAAETVRLLSFDGAARWADTLVAEADRDAGKIWLGGVQVSAAVAKASAAAVARAIVRTRMETLEGRALGEIQGWSDADEAVVAELRGQLRRGGAGAGRYAEGAYAAHAVAAAVYEAVSGSSTPARAMDAMQDVLAAMHERNADWPAARVVA